MTQPPHGNDPSQYGGQPPSNQPPPYGQPGYGQPQYSGGQPPYGGQPGGAGGYEQQPRGSRTGLFIAIGVIVVLLLAGGVGAFLLLGGDDEGDSDATASDESTSTPATAVETATTSAEPTTSAELTTSAEPATSEPPPTGATTSPGETFCERFRKNAESNEFDSPEPADLPKVLAELQIFLQLAPPELKDDYQLLIDAINEGGATDTAVALQNIATYAVDECGLVLD